MLRFFPVKKTSTFLSSLTRLLLFLYFRTLEISLSRTLSAHDAPRRSLPGVQRRFAPWPP